MQQEGENFREFLAELKKLSLHCGFGDNTRLEEELLEQLVRGIQDDRLRTQFLSTPELTFEQVVNKATAAEIAKLDADKLKGVCSSNSNQISKINAKYTKKTFDKVANKSVGNKVPKSNINSKEGVLISCYRCGKAGHTRSKCRVDRNIKCVRCNKQGHMAAACRSTNQTKSSRENAESNFVYISKVMDANKASHFDKIYVTVQINNSDCEMEVDTGSPVSIISLKNFKKIAPQVKRLDRVHTTFVSYTKDPIRILGKTKVLVNYKNQNIQGDLYIADNELNTLCGREWLQQLKLNWLEIKQTQRVVGNVKKEVNLLIKEFADVFKNELGCIKEIAANIELKEGCRPIHMGPRKVPYALTERVNQEIDRLESLGILERVSFSDWATPIVPIVESNGKDIRICGDYKVTVNKNIVPEHHPIPNIEEILSSMQDAQYFAKFDIREAYLHIPTTIDAANILAITTQKGLYRVKRLLFGVTNAPAIWQRTMDDLFRGIPGTRVFYDDVKITASSKTEFVRRIRKFLEICRKTGIRLKKDKCEVDCDGINYLGYRLDKHGLHKTKEKIEAISSAKRPTNETELKSFLGLVNYYNRFIPNASNRLHHMYELLGKEKEFKWSEKCEKAFQASNQERDCQSTRIMSF